MDEHEGGSGRGATSGDGAELTELTVVGVRVELPSQQPIVLLKEVSGDRYLPIWIGAVEATAIAFAQQGVVTARPMTHDLLKDVLDALGRPLVEVHVTDLRDGVFYAELHLGPGAGDGSAAAGGASEGAASGDSAGPAGEVVISARPSDAIALALRTGAVIRSEESVLAEAGIAIPDEQEDEVERFREFLDTISPEDFEQES